MIKGIRRKRPASTGQPSLAVPAALPTPTVERGRLAQTRHQLDGRVLSGGVLLDVRADLIGPRFLITFGIRAAPAVRAVAVVESLVARLQHAHAGPSHTSIPSRHGNSRQGSAGSASRSPTRVGGQLPGVNEGFDAGSA